MQSWATGSPAYVSDQLKKSPPLLMTSALKKTGRRIFRLPVMNQLLIARLFTSRQLPVLGIGEFLRQSGQIGFACLRRTTFL